MEQLQIKRKNSECYLRTEFSSVTVFSSSLPQGLGTDRPGLALAPLWEGAKGGYLACLPDHDVVTVPVPNAQHVGGHAVASTGQGELLDGLVQGISRQGNKSEREFYCSLQ